MAQMLQMLYLIAGKCLQMKLEWLLLHGVQSPSSHTTFVMKVLVLFFCQKLKIADKTIISHIFLASSNSLV